MPSHDPRARLEEQWAHCRAAWRAMTPERAERARDRLRRREDRLARAWLRTLDRAHPLAQWLDRDASFSALPDAFPDGLSPRALVSSHPFTDFHPWFNPLMSPGSSSTPPA